MAPAILRQKEPFDGSNLLLVSSFCLPISLRQNSMKCLPQNNAVSFIDFEFRTIPLYQFIAKRDLFISICLLISILTFWVHSMNSYGSICLKQLFQGSTVKNCASN